MNDEAVNCGGLFEFKVRWPNGFEHLARLFGAALEIVLQRLLRPFELDGRSTATWAWALRNAGVVRELKIRL